MVSNLAQLEYRVHGRMWWKVGLYSSGRDQIMRGLYARLKAFGFYPVGDEEPE